MKELNNYILEKLRINKDIKLSMDDNFIDGILSIILNSKYKPQQENLLKSSLSDWIEENVDFTKKIKVNVYIEKRFDDDKFTDLDIQNHLIKDLGINFMYDKQAVDNYINKLNRVSSIILYSDKIYSFIYAEKLKKNDCFSMTTVCLMEQYFSLQNLLLSD